MIAALLLLALVGGPSIEIAVDTTFTRADVVEGDIRQVATADVPDDLVGATCGIEVRADNGPSVHPNSDLIVESGGDTAEVPDVERAPGARTTATSDLTLGDTIVVRVRIGSDARFSAGIVVTVDCSRPEPTTTTTTEPTTTTTVSTTTVPVLPTTPTVVTTTTTTTQPEQTPPTSIIPPTTTTTVPPISPVSSTTEPVQPGEPVELPRTGPGGFAPLVLSAVVLLAFGALAAVLALGIGGSNRDQ